MNNPAQGEQPDYVPAYRPPGSPLADAYGASADPTGYSQSLKNLRALYTAASEPTSQPAAPSLTPSAARSLRSDIQTVAKAMEAETDPVQKSVLGERLTQMRLKALFSGTLHRPATKAAGTMPVEADDDKLNAVLPLCGNCAGAGTVPVGNFKRAECPGCKGAGRISPGDRATNASSDAFDLAAGKPSAAKGISPVSKALWDRLDKDMAAAQALEKQARSGGRPARDNVAKSTQGFQTLTELVRHVQAKHQMRF